MRAVVLPGRAYPVTAPLLATAVGVLERHGYDVRGVAWTLTDLPPDPAGFVGDHLATASEGGCDLVVAKSLGCWGAAAAGEWPAVWLTPVLTAPACAAGIRSREAPQLVVAGLADPFHDPVVAAGLGCDVVEIDGLDHALAGPGADVPTTDTLARVDGAIDDFLRRLR